MIINYANLFNVPKENMPKKMFVFTDMQFNNASNNSHNLETVYKTIIKKYNDMKKIQDEILKNKNILENLDTEIKNKKEEC